MGSIKTHKRLGIVAMTLSPYLKANQLSDVLAAVQTMALLQYYRHSTEDWAFFISGDKKKEGHWRDVFDDHPEFFRKATGGKYSLILRRASPRRFHTKEGRAITSEEFEALSEERKADVSRSPVSDSQLRLLMDLAINLHQNAIEAKRDKRWWFAPALSFIASFGATFIAINMKH